MQRKKEVFRIGTKVEVTCKEEGFLDSWYTCTIIRKPRRLKDSPACKKHQKCSKLHYWVEYQTICDEENQSQPLRECIEASLIRPLPPSSSACTTNFQMFDVVEANYSDGWWVGAIVEVRNINDGFKYLVAFESPYDEIEFRRDELRHHLSWLGGNKWTHVPKKIVQRCRLDGNETVRSFQLQTIPTEISTMERMPSPAERLKLATRDNAEGSQSLGRKNIVQALEAPPLLSQSCRLSSSEGNPRCKRKMNGNSKKNDCKSYKKIRRVGPNKEAVQRFLTLLEDGEEPGESGAMHERIIEQSPTSDIAGSHCISQTNELQISEIVDEIIDIEEVVDKQGDWQSNALVVYPNPTLNQHSQPHLASVSLHPLSDQSLTWLFTKRSEMWKESMEIVLYTSTNPALTECSKPHPATVVPISDQSRTWPFTMRSKMWKVIKSMEVFKRVPQMLHFSPLTEHKEDMREGIAICMMMKFAYEVERITSVSPDDLQRTNIIHDILGNLKELEPHGFNTTPLEVYLNELLETMDRENKLQEDLDKVKSGVRECQAEKNDADRKLSELVEQMKSFEAQLNSAKSVKDLKEQQLSELESKKDIISSELHHIRLTKKPFQW
ncbi:hypothetical protein LIER_34768 [Lithospermum erythrorhizon]|uniref:Agenet domain-containing protein n=1 Tax=Lithospermum erythrorhizon TaxID=34254 RepID=A0AAV3S2R5_LITER